MHIEDENQFKKYLYRKRGGMEHNRATVFDCHWKKGVMGRDVKLSPFVAAWRQMGWLFVDSISMGTNIYQDVQQAQNYALSPSSTTTKRRAMCVCKIKYYSCTNYLISFFLLPTHNFILKVLYINYDNIQLRAVLFYTISNQDDLKLFIISGILPL